MGIIKRQTIKGSIFSYLGVTIGYLNVIVLMSNFFTTSQIGLTQLLISLSSILGLVGTLGFGSVSVRMFPYFKNHKNRHNGYPFLLLATGIAGFISIVVVYNLMEEWIVNTNIDKSSLFVDYLFLLTPLIFFRLFYYLFDGYSKALSDPTTGIFWNEFGYKFMNLIFISLFVFGTISFEQYMYGFTFAYSFPAIPILIKLIRKGNFNLTPKFDFLHKQLTKQIVSVSAFGLIGTSSAVLVLNIDRVMVNQYLSLSTTGIFSICALFGTIIKIPNTALSYASIPILAESWKNNNLSKIFETYYKSTINQLIFATLLFIGIVGNLDNIFRILPEEYSEGRYVVVIYSLAFLLMTSNGVGSFVLSTSPKYKVQTYLLILTSILTVVSNIIFIPILGMNGAAIATLVTYLSITLLKVLYLKYNMKLFPYNYKHAVTLLVGGVSLLPVLFIGNFSNLIIDIIVKSGVIVIIYIPLILIFNLSDEISYMYKKSITYFRN